MTNEEKLVDRGYDDSVIIPEYDDVIIGVTTDGAVVYDMQKMVECFVRDNFKGVMNDDNVVRAIEGLEYNTIRALPYANKLGVPPVIMERLEE